MMRPTILVALPGNDELVSLLAHLTGVGHARLQLHRFPDGEIYVRYPVSLEGQTVVLVCTLDRPNEKVLPLIFAADASRELGATSVGLIAPYLAYMRQDQRFKPGEAVTSQSFANLISNHFDWLVTVDPHLHRYHHLPELYKARSFTVQSAPLISKWIKSNVVKPLIIGPDVESEQWVAAVAQRADAPYAVLAKTRYGDRDVQIAIPWLEHWWYHTPVLVDDIISTGATMIQTLGKLKEKALRPPICVAIHGVFANGAHEAILGAGAERIVTTNTIPHKGNAIDISELLAAGLRDAINP